jgi:4-hydroxy-tetrahydrodipicolinate reductase
MKIGVLGCAGRMGKTHLTAILDSEKHEVAAGLERTDSEYIGKDIGSLLGRDPIGITVSGDKEAAIEASDAIIDFTSPALTLECAALAAKHGVIHIIGTTGLDDAQKATLAKHAEKTQIIFAPNMSVGVNLLFSLVEKVASVLDDDFDIEVVEMHHNQKVDSPSGTALGLGEAAAKGRGIALNDVACKARDGQVGAFCGRCGA